MFFLFLSIGILSYIFPWVFLTIVGLGLLSRKQWLMALLAVSIGYLYAFCYEAFDATKMLPHVQESKIQWVSGCVDSLVTNQSGFLTFLLNTKEYGLIKLNWYKARLVPQAAQCGAWQVRLKRPHGLHNPGGFDETHFLKSMHIHATGYVVSAKLNPTIPKNLLALRSLLNEKLKRDHDPYRRFIAGLTIGVRDQFTAEDWQVLRNTGTNHLFVIAGLHMGLLSGLIFSIVNFLWRRSTFCMLWLPAQQAAAWSALLTGIGYAALAGFSIPTERALVMMIAFLGGVVLRRKVNAWYAFNLALAIVLILNPFAAYDRGFWLSFTAVAVIIYALTRHAARGDFLRMQVVLAIGLLPLGFLFFEQTSLVAPLANFLLVPFVGFVVVPLSLLGTLSLLFNTTIANSFLYCATKTMMLAWWILEKLSHWSGSNITFTLQAPWMMIALSLACLLLLSPRGMPAKYLWLFLCIPLLVNHSRPLPNGTFILTVLDIGQGLSCVIQTAHHVLVYDAGAKKGVTLDRGESVVVPYLQHQAIHRIDRIVISHGDNDHRGGLESIVRAIPTDDIETSVPRRIPHSRLCLRGEQWQWDGVKFQFLYPTPHTLHLGNNSSCVLRISSGNHAVLLVGDIERFAEQTLLHLPSELSADVLVAPHHGSHTSSTAPFIQRVYPHLVIFSTGYLNQFHFPHPTIVARYTTFHVQQLTTAIVGAVQVRVSGEGIKLNTELSARSAS